VLARLTGGKADGWICVVTKTPVFITMVDRVPVPSPERLGTETDDLLARASGKWESYTRVQDDDAEPDGAVMFRCNRALPTYPPDDPPLIDPPTSMAAKDAEDFIDRLQVDPAARERVRGLLQDVGYQGE